MTGRDRINAIFMAFHGVKWSNPWRSGHDAWKVYGKIFACSSAVIPGMSVKTDRAAWARTLV
jgi:hypothetical protein